MKYNLMARKVEVSNLDYLADLDKDLTLDGIVVGYDEVDGTYLVVVPEEECVSKKADLKRFNGIFCFASFTLLPKKYLAEMITCGKGRFIWATSDCLKVYSQDVEEEYNNVQWHLVNNIDISYKDDWRTILK